MNKKMLLPLITGVLLCFVAGCKESAPPEKPVVVKKSIDQTATKTPETESEHPQTTVQTQPQDKKEATVTETPETTAAPTATPAEAKGPPAVAEGTARQEKASAPAAESPAPVVADSGAPAPETAQAEAPTPAPKGQAPAPQKQTAGTDEGTSEQPVETEAETASLKNTFLGEDTIPSYDSTGKIDPFAALFSDKSDEAAEDDTTPKRPLTPLEKIDISQLKLVAVLLAKSGDRAMVEDATGKPYILSPGTYIGINSGTVSQILKDRVVIEEKSKDILGRETSRTRELKLQKPLGEE